MLENTNLIAFYVQLNNVLYLQFLDFSEKIMKPFLW